VNPRAEDVFLGPLRYLLDSADPVDAEAVGSALATLWADGEDSTLEPEEVLVVIDGLAATGRAEALAVLRGLSAVLPDLHAVRARRVADQMVAAGVPEPRWAPQVGRARVAGAWVMSHLLGDGDNVILLCRYPDGHEHTLVTYIDHNLGSLVKDAFLGPPDTLDRFRELTADEPDTTIEPVPPAQAAARIRAAIDVSDRTFPAYESETWPGVRLLLEARLATAPTDGAAPHRLVVSTGERDRLVEEFFASSEGRVWRDDPDAWSIVEELVWFRCDHGDGRPLRCSPVVVEILLADFFPRKVAGEPARHAKVPDLVRSWVRFASRRQSLPQRLVDEILDAVDEFADEGIATPESFDWRGVPADLRPRVEEVLAHCDRVCAEALDVEYAALARRLTAKLARKRPTPLRRGDLRIWAGGVLYALGQVNFLFDPHARPHLPGKQLAAVVGLNRSTIAAKANVVREAVRLRDFDDEFTRSDVRAALPW
jgi:hypothetical protein